MSKPKLQSETCRECKKLILVCPYSPHELADKATGVAAHYRYEDEDGNSFAGWICLDCAWRSANTKGGGMIGGGGPPGDWEFHY